MNPRITDLLDDYVDTSVQLFPPDQVLRGTGSGKKKSPNQKPAHHRMKKPLVAAAALLLVLTGIAAGYLTFSRGSSGTSLGGGPSDTPAISEVPTTPEPAQSTMDSAENAAVSEDIVLDDTNSVIVTSESTGLSMRVPTEFQDGLKTDDSFTLATIYSEDESVDFNSVFTFYDTSNQDNSSGVVFAIYAWNQSAFDSYMSDPTRNATYDLNSVVLGTDATLYYSMLQFGNSLSTRFPHFDDTDPDSIRNYYARLQYVIPMVNSFIELNGLSYVNRDLDDWADLFRQRMLEPMEELIAQLEDASPQQDIQEAAQTEESTAALDLSPAEDVHISEPTGDRSAVETSTLTSSTGLSITVLPECMDAVEFYVDDTITLTNELSCNIDVVFAAFDQRNLDSGGFLWAIIDGSPDSMPLDLPEGYQWDVMGQLDGETYSIIMPTADNLQFDENSLADTMSYDNHVQAMQWNLSDVIRAVTNYSPYEDATQDWERDYVELVY